MSKVKKILTLDQLVKFCEQNKMYAFSSKDVGYTLSVRVPATFSGEVESDKGLLFCPIKVCHIDKNRNGSYISRENMEKAMPSLKYRPFLAAIHQLDSGEWDFHAHDIEIVKNEEGEEEFNYIEKQIGCFTADDPYLQYDEEMDKTYVIGKVAIPEEYTKAADIIRRKNGSKVSCEISIESMSYNAKEKVLELEDFYFSGCTGLGAEKDGTEIGEGMLGSKIALEDFSTKNNSVFSDNEVNTKLIEVLEKLESKIDGLSNFNINEQNAQKNLKKGGETDVETNENFEEVADTTVENAEKVASTEETTDEEVAATENESEDTVNESSEEAETETTETETTETETTETETTETEACGGKKKKKCELENGDMELTYEISHDDIRYALYNLIESYEELDNDYYYIRSVYDNKFVMQGWCTNNIYGQKYTRDGDNVALEGERYKLYEELLTETEKAELDSMRSNYSSISEKLARYEADELKKEKEEIFANEAYSKYLDSEEFVSLKSEMDNFSVEELSEKADLAFAKCVKKLGFSLKEKEEKKPSKINFARTLVDDKPKKISFLEGLLNK